MSRRRGGSNSNDLISQMPDDALVTILSFLPIKEAAATSCLSSRWRFLWCNVTRLNFEGPKTYNLLDSQWSKYMNQVNSVIQSYNQSVVQDFRIQFELTNHSKTVFDEWLQFAVNKKVEFLELTLSRCRFEWSESYHFPLILFDTQLYRRPSSNAIFVEILSLKKLVLKMVNVTDAILQEFLTNCPHLETIVIHCSSCLKHVRVGGRALNLKHFEIMSRLTVESIYLSNFDLVSFTYKGPPIDLRFTNLPKLNEVDMYEGYVGRNPHNVFDQISFCSVSLQALSINIHDDHNPKYYVTLSLQNIAKLDSFPELPNVKKFRLVIGGRKCDCFLDLALILNACPNIQTFEIKPLWTSPIISRRKAREVTNPIKNLKLVKIVGYYGRKCDLQLVEYIIHSAVSLKKIVIDPFEYNRGLSPAAFNFLKNKEVARSTTEDQLKSILGSALDAEMSTPCCLLLPV
ncbi:F-box domain, FBD domain, Leucine-rich repeat domain, L domain-like protein [Artemisia annua]|uniref:F-box domain, FBD domain, Leucine-rich repeat domain, L domain-like protein n=1 Tax=Artemisia annua TaxID=35608 RepID=A0A2U1LFQ1_ARTAN|nr:F-box domain, FBD domain, Leucine-rich repeat domain, L domain-like protein [Artemisia annua]